MDKKDRDFLYRLETYTRDLATYKYQNKDYQLEDNYSYKYIQETLNSCSEFLRWILKDHLKVIWKIATLEAELNTYYYGEFLKRKAAKDKIDYLKKECLIIRDISERSIKEEPKESLDMDAIEKGYEHLKETLKKQEEWLKRNPSKLSEFKEEIDNTRERIKDLEEFLRRVYEEKERRN